VDEGGTNRRGVDSYHNMQGSLGRRRVPISYIDTWTILGAICRRAFWARNGFGPAARVTSELAVPGTSLANSLTWLWHLRCEGVGWRRKWRCGWASCVIVVIENSQDAWSITEVER
jgi:hypothetical protein